MTRISSRPPGFAPGVVTVEMSCRDLSFLFSRAQLEAMLQDQARRLQHSAYGPDDRRERELASKVVLEIALNDIADDLDSDGAATLAGALGLSLIDTAGIQEAEDRLRWRDVRGALLALGAVLPRRFRLLADDLARAVAPGAS